MTEPVEAWVDADSLDVVSMLNVALRGHRFILAVIAICVMIAIPLELRRQPTYTATAGFTPESGSGSSGSVAAGLAAQFGLSLGGPSGGADGPEFYVELSRSREILGAVADHRYSVHTDSGTVVADIATLLHVAGATPAERRHDAVVRLQSIITSDLSLKSGVITVSVKTANAELSYQIVTELLADLNRFNLDRRQSKAAAERRFVEERMRQAQDSLALAESALKIFLIENRETRGSPELTFEAGKLTREVSFQEEIYTTLAQSFEQAKISEVRDTPVITVIESPEIPVERDARGRVRQLIFVLLGSALAATLLLFGQVYIKRTTSGNPATRELRHLWQATLRDLWRPWRMFRRKGT